MDSYVTDFLFARPSFLEGIGRLFDFGNTLNEYNHLANPDSIALRMDWLCVGQDLRFALKEYDQETTTQAEPAIPA